MTTLRVLRLPSDHLEACALLCSALSDLGPVDDGDGLVADRIRDAHRLLERALSGVQSCLPKRGNDFAAVIPPCTCDEDTRLRGHHPKPCQHGKTLWVHVSGAGDKGCLSHHKAGIHVPSGPVKGACTWCYDFQRRYHRIPPPELVRHHDAGYRLSPAMLAQALAKKPKKGPAKPATPKRQPNRRERMHARVAAAAARIAGR